MDDEIVVRDPNIYLEDENIVLSAKDGRGCIVYFRLHPAQRMDYHDGVPLVEMAGDSADALHSLIALLNDPQCISVILEDEDFAARMYKPVDGEVGETLAAEDSASWRPGDKLCRLPEPVHAIPLARTFPR
ncbi:hypothetical protein C8F04DRAFT_1249212 [Mycena alexandri]|uniref:Uncharacterized protein n=1 Tax=Mycena alexandri TaxID=1745969 RepID=A0AAD6TIB8_9AGAR|nr:hypothetical protein C8F04DRAFT_1249212 [Mycena alexandri]